MVLHTLQSADLMLLSVVAPMELVHHFTTFDPEGILSCKLGEYARVLSEIAAILNLVAVTIER